MFLQLTESMNFSKQQKEDHGIMIKPSDIIHFEYKDVTRNGLIIVNIKHGPNKGSWQGACNFEETRDIIRNKRGTIWIYRVKQY